MTALLHRVALPVFGNAFVIVQACSHVSKAQAEEAMPHFDDHQVPTEPAPDDDPVPDQNPAPDKEPIPDHNPVADAD